MVGMSGDALAGTGSHHLYVHVPFCRLVCAYCDFVTVGGRREEVPRYVEALLAELRLRPASGTLDTVYFGGGTPSLLPATDVDRVAEAAAQRWGDRPVEVTLEANPSDRERPDWAGLRAAGVTRVSLGVQSLRDPDLRVLARGHTAREARGAYAAARSAGFGDISLDLIYGIPGQTLEDWRTGLLAAVALEPDHLSLYALQVILSPDEWAAPPREGALRWRRRIAARQDDDLTVEQYRLAEELLASRGFEHYELSSWARPGHRSWHNSAYWARRPYTGIGAGAHSYDGTSRTWNTRDLDAYLARIADGSRPLEGSESLDEPTRAFEAIALGLRRVSGMSRAAFAAEFGEDPVDRFGRALADAAASGLLELDGDVIRLSPDGRLLASEVLVAFLPAAERAPAPVG
jgi:oxygen-independent coproporphyrinogen III oxidase